VPERSGTAQPLSNEERQRIEREIRHSWNTRWPEGDSWVKGYAQDCQTLLDEIDRLNLNLGAAVRVADGYASALADRGLL
jgi:hypothetical protein